MGADAETWRGVLGCHGVGKCNANGELLLSLCSEYNLVVTNTLFNHKEVHKKSWMHPRSKHSHLLDYIIVRQSDRHEVLDTRAMRGADCGTDHIMLRSRMKFRPTKPHKKVATKPPSKLNTKKLKAKETQAELAKHMDSNLSSLGERDAGVEENWKQLRDVVYDTAKSVLGKPDRKHQDWFDEYDERLQQLIETRNKARDAKLKCGTRSKKKVYSKAQSALQKYTRGERD